MIMSLGDRDVEVAVGVDMADVDRGPEPVGRRRQQRRTAQVSVSGAHRRAQIHLAEFAGAHGLAVLVQNPDFGVAVATADAGCASHSSPRSAVIPRPSVIP